MTRLSSGYPKWYEEYNFKDSSYGELKGYQALRKALEELVDNKGQPTLKKNGEPYAIFDKIREVIDGEGSEKLILAAKENPVDVLAEREERIGRVPEEPITPEEVAEARVVTDETGLLDDAVKPHYLSNTMSEAYYTQTRPMIDQLFDTLTTRGKTGGSKIPDELMPDVMKFIDNKIQPELTTVKAPALKTGMALRDAALLDYTDQRGWDTFANYLYPYQFWYTRSMLNWLSRMWDRPAWFGNWYRFRKFMSSTATKPGYPQRLRNKVAFPAPFLPEWAGGELYFDPLNNVFPFEQLLGGYSQYSQSISEKDKAAMSIIYQWREQGTVGNSQADDAIQTREGSVWAKAVAQAQLDDESGKFDPFQFINLVMLPAMWISYPYFLLTGKTMGFKPQT